MVGLPLAGMPSRLWRALRDGMATSASPGKNLVSRVSFVNNLQLDRSS
jgi:hypothetical protein